MESPLTPALKKGLKMYYAKGNEVWVESKPEDEKFLIVVETEAVRSGAITLEKQAMLIAKFINEAVFL